VPLATEPHGAPERLRPWEISVGFTGSAVPGASTGRDGFELFAGGLYSKAAVASATRPFVALGLELGLGSAVRSVRAGGLTDEKRSMPAWTLGPEVRLGLGMGRPTELTSVYLALTPFYTATDRPASWAAESGGTWAFRAVAGVSLLDSWLLVPDAMPHGGSCEAGLCGFSLLLLLLPTTLELGWERVRNENRGAIFLGYTL